MTKDDKLQSKNPKTMMCPLKDQCPDDIRPRWPESDNKTTTQLGSKCPYAHHNWEITFPQQQRQRIHAMQQIKKMIENKMQQDFNKPVWHPGGAIKECTGCGKTYSEALEKRDGGKGGIKGLCNHCDYQQRAAYLNQKLLKGIKKKQPKIQKYEEEKQREIFMRQKLSLFRKAQTLFSKERINEAFQVIIQASQMVILERIRVKRKIRIKEKKLINKLQNTANETQKQKKPKQIKNTASSKVAVNFLVNVINKIRRKYLSNLRLSKISKEKAQKYSIIMQSLLNLYLSKKQNAFYTIESYESKEQIAFQQPQTEQFWKEKQQSEGKLDANIYMNYEIEKLYFKIKNQIEGIYKNIDFLNSKIESYEVQPKKVITQFCEKGINCRNLKCQKAHKFQDFEFVDSYQAEQNLSSAIRNLEEKVKSDPSKPAWVPSGCNKLEYPQGVIDSRIFECKLEEEELL